MWCSSSTGVAVPLQTRPVVVMVPVDCHFTPVEPEDQSLGGFSTSRDQLSIN